MPNGPALFGPMRFCMSAMTLRSNQTINIVPTRPTTKIDDDLEQHDAATSPSVRSPIEQRVEGEHQSVSIRTSVTGAVRIDELADARRRAG